jgi:hypothetical protein
MRRARKGRKEFTICQVERAKDDRANWAVFLYHSGVSFFDMVTPNYTAMANRGKP